MSNAENTTLMMFFQLVINNKQQNCQNLKFDLNMK